MLRSLPAAWLACGLAACGNASSDAASQVAAKVNREELSVHQLNFLLQHGAGGAAGDQAGAQVLERLIEQELAVQRATELRIDREPQVLQQLETARREIIARAYMARVAETAAKPDQQQVTRYYADNPGLFEQRRVYALQETQVLAEPQQVAALRTRLPELDGREQLADYLQANKLRFTAAEVVRSAEQLPLPSVDAFAQMKEGETVLTPTPHGAVLLTVLSTRHQPVDEPHARPAIEQFLTNENKRKLIADEMKRLRAAAKIEYVGPYAQRAKVGGGVPEPAEGFASGPLGSNTINNGMGLKQ